MFEQGVKRWMFGQNKVELPAGPWVRRLMIVPMMLWLGQHLFFSPAVHDTDIADRVMRACQAIYHSLLRTVNDFGHVGMRPDDFYDGG